MSKHDGVLFPFCQLRRDIMKFRYDCIMQDPPSLSCEENESIKRLSRVLDNTIHNYNEHKVHMFNVRKVMKYLNQHRDTLAEIASLETTTNPAIKEFHSKFANCFAKAFLAYTPLIRSQASVFILVVLIRFVYQAGHKTISQKLKTDAEKIRAMAGRTIATA